MRFLFVLFAIATIMTWYAWAIRPVKREQSNLLYGIAGALFLLLIGGYLRWL